MSAQCGSGDTAGIGVSVIISGKFIVRSSFAFINMELVMIKSK